MNDQINEYIEVILDSILNKTISVLKGKELLVELYKSGYDTGMNTGKCLGAIEALEKLKQTDAFKPILIKVPNE